MPAEREELPCCSPFIRHFIFRNNGLHELFVRQQSAAKGYVCPACSPAQLQNELIRFWQNFFHFVVEARDSPGARNIFKPLQLRLDPRQTVLVRRLYKILQPFSIWQFQTMSSCPV